MPETITDGMKWDTETGECLGSAAPKFEVKDEASFEWVMERLQKAEFDIARAKQIESNATIMRKQAEARHASLLYRFQGELENYARENLPDGKKTLSCPFGKVAFRKTAPKWEVADEEKAIAWALKNCPAAVKTKLSLLKSEIPVDPLVSVSSGLLFVAGSESVSIKGEL